MKRLAAIALALIAAAGLAGCEGDDPAGLEYNFEGAWMFTYADPAGGWPVSSELIRIRQDGDAINLTRENGVRLAGLCDTVDGTFSVTDSGTITPPEPPEGEEPDPDAEPVDPVTWDFRYLGAAVDSKTMRGTTRYTIGTTTQRTVLTATWVAELQVR
jgi:hypothetical protein